MLRDVEVGDWVFTIKSGWGEVEEINENVLYCIKIKNKRYTRGGKVLSDDFFPSAWKNPPEGFNVGVPPCDFKKNQEVFVWDENMDYKIKRHFSHYKNGIYYCFDCGRTSWTKKKVTGWKYCLLPENVMDSDKEY